MSDEDFAKLINAVSSSIRATIPQGNKAKAFLSFGALLWYVRDMPRKLPFDTDLDMSFVYGQIDFEAFCGNLSGYGYKLKKCLAYKGYPLQAVFAPHSPQLRGQPGPKTEIDCWFWIKANGFYWHCGDFDNGGSKFFTFKGIPDKWIDGKSDIFETIQGGATPSDIAPTLNIPVFAGTLFDYWYPPKRAELSGVTAPIPGTQWFTKNPMYGQSRTEKVIIMHELNNFEERLK